MELTRESLFPSFSQVLDNLKVRVDEDAEALIRLSTADNTPESEYHSAAKHSENI